MKINLIIMRYLVLFVGLILASCGGSGKSGLTLINGNLMKLEKVKDSERKKAFIESDTMERLTRRLVDIEKREMKKDLSNNPKSIFGKLSDAKTAVAGMANTDNAVRVAALGKEYYYFILSDIMSWKMQKGAIFGYAYQKMPDYELAAVVADYIKKSYKAWQSGQIVKTDSTKNKMYMEMLKYFLKSYNPAKESDSVLSGFKMPGSSCADECARSYDKMQSVSAIADLGGGYVKDIGTYTAKSSVGRK